MRLFLFLMLAAAGGDAFAKNGFDLSGASIPAGEILQGGPPRDGIPSIDNPKFVGGDKAKLADDDLILGLAVNNDARAYPIRILNWHEVVNDDFGGLPTAITYCPLCGSGVAFVAQQGGKRMQFGVSGLLYNSDVLLYDRQTESLWSQLLRRAVSGEFVGATLASLPIQHTTWGDWRRQYPDSRALSVDTGFSRDYRRDPYAGYDKEAATIFPTSPKAPPSLHSKEWVLGIAANGEAKAYPFSELKKHGEKTFADRVGGRDIVLHWNAKARAARMEAGDNKPPPDATRAFWFAWFAFHPQTKIFRADEN